MRKLTEQLWKEQKSHAKTLRKLKRLEFEVQALKDLLEKGSFNMEYSSTDCDGVSSYGIIDYTSLEEFYEDEERTAEWADGPFYFSYTKEDVIPVTSSGQGWGIN